MFLQDGKHQITETQRDTDETDSSETSKHGSNICSKHIPLVILRVFGQPKSQPLCDQTGHRSHLTITDRSPVGSRRRGMCS